MARIAFDYGDEKVSLEIPDRQILGIIKKNPEGQSPRPVEELVKEALTTPQGTPNLSHILRKNRPGYLVIIVSDISRNISNYCKILDILVGEIVESGVDEANIEFIVALGTHREHTSEEQKELYGSLPEKFKFSFHNCHQNLKEIGKTSTGLKILINEKVVAADFVITTGLINFHYLAGFSGGRKSILPGVAGYETIRANHAKLLRSGIGIGSIEKNIIDFEMAETAQIVGVDFALNVIEDLNRNTVWVKAGKLKVVFKQGVDFILKNYSRPIKKQADCIFVSGGSTNRDFFNAHKILNFAIDYIKPGGAIVLFAKCENGLGNEKFVKYLKEYRIDTLLNFDEKEIEVGGHRAFVTARILKNYKVYLVTSIDQEILSQLQLRSIKVPNSIIDELKRNYGENFTAFVNPDGIRIKAICD